MATPPSCPHARQRLAGECRTCTLWRLTRAIAAAGRREALLMSVCGLGVPECLRGRLHWNRQVIKQRGKRIAAGEICEQVFGTFLVPPMMQSLELCGVRKISRPDDLDALSTAKVLQPTCSQNGSPDLFISHCRRGLSSGPRVSRAASLHHLDCAKWEMLGQSIVEVSKVQQK